MVKSHVSPVSSGYRVQLRVQCQCTMLVKGSFTHDFMTFSLILNTQNALYITFVCKVLLSRPCIRVQHV